MILSKVLTVMHTWLPLIMQGVAMTIAISCCGLLIGVIFGVLLGVGNCNKLKHAVLSKVINFYVLVLRGTPLYVQVLIVYYALPEATGINLSPFSAGVLALGCNSIAYVAEIIRAGINAVPVGQWDAAYVLGYSRSKALTLIIMPQALKNILPALVNEATALIKESSILAAIGLLEMTRVAINVSAKTLDPMSIYLGIAVIYLLLTTSVSFLAKKIEQKLEVGHDHH